MGVIDIGHCSFIDDHSCKKFAMPLKRKSDTFGAFKKLSRHIHTYTEKQTGKKVKCLREDKGGE
jgi:uncharacterized protein YbcC (UPF0753/DUF2309 family)